MHVIVVIKFPLLYFLCRVVRQIHICQEYDKLAVEQAIQANLPAGHRKKVPNEIYPKMWQAAAIGALHEASEAHLVGVWNYFFFFFNLFCV